MSTHVWVMEHGEYEQCTVWGVYSSPEAAMAGLRATYGDPHIVRWEPIEIHDEDHAWITGHFEAVPGFSTKHTAEYDLRRYTIDEERA